MTTPEPNEGYAGFTDPPEEPKPNKRGWRPKWDAFVESQKPLDQAGNKISFGEYFSTFSEHGGAGPAAPVAEADTPVTVTNTPELNNGYATLADPPEEAKTSREISLEKSEAILDKKWGENTWKERLFKGVYYSACVVVGGVAGIAAASAVSGGRSSGSRRADWDAGWNSQPGYQMPVLNSLTPTGPPRPVFVYDGDYPGVPHFRHQHMNGLYY